MYKQFLKHDDFYSIDMMRLDDSFFDFSQDIDSANPQLHNSVLSGNINTHPTQALFHIQSICFYENSLKLSAIFTIESSTLLPQS